MFRRVWDKEGARTEPEPGAQTGDYSVFIDGQALDPKNIISQVPINMPPTPVSSSARGNASTPGTSSDKLSTSTPEYELTTTLSHGSSGTILDEDELIEQPQRFSGLMRKQPPETASQNLQPPSPQPITRRPVPSPSKSHRSSSDFELRTDTSNSSTYSQSIDQPPRSSGSGSSKSASSRGRSKSEAVPQRDFTLTPAPQKVDLSSSFKNLSSFPPPSPQKTRERSGTTGSSNRKEVPNMPLPLDMQSIRDGKGKEVFFPSQNPGKEVVSPMSMVSPHYLLPHPGTPAPDDGSDTYASPLPFSPGARGGYSWNERVDVQALGVRPGETEVMATEIQGMKLRASYTGDMHGRWDDCRVRIFKDTGDTNLKLRILTVQVGAEEAVDQQFSMLS